MKKIKAVLLSIMLISVASTGNAQTEPSTPCMFGNVRSEKPQYFHDFGEIKKTPESYTLKIKNTGDLVIDIIDLNVPARISITAMEFHINPGEEGTIILTLDPFLFEKGMFYTPGSIITQEIDSGKIKTDTIKFYLKGEVL